VVFQHPAGYHCFFNEAQSWDIPRRVVARAEWPEGELSCHRFVANRVRLWPFILAYNLGVLIRRLALPESVKRWSLRGVRTRLIKTGGRLVFQMAEVVATGDMFERVLALVEGLCPGPGYDCHRRRGGFEVTWGRV
jgi:hypothetical protein